jgi:hypothetical protein
VVVPAASPPIIGRARRACNGIRVLGVVDSLRESENPGYPSSFRRGLHWRSEWTTLAPKGVWSTLPALLY